MIHQVFIFTLLMFSLGSTVFCVHFAHWLKEKANRIAALLQLQSDRSDLHTEAAVAFVILCDFCNI